MDPDPSPTRIDPHLEVREHKKGVRPGDAYVRIVRPFETEFERGENGHWSPPARHPLSPPGCRARPGRCALVPDRPPDLIGAGGARAAHQAQGAGRLQQRQHQLIGLCHRGDDAGAGGGRGERLRPGHAADLVIVSCWPSWPPATARRSRRIRTAPRATSWRRTTWGSGRPVAAGALLIDYTLTVAVSVSAGVAAITSMVPALLPKKS